MTIELDYSKWKAALQRHGAADFAKLPTLSVSADTIHSFEIGRDGGGPTLDVLARNFGRSAKSHFLVVFSAALGATARVNGRPPYFSGDGLSQASGLPLLAFSDPTLALDDEVKLGWYIGNDATGPLFGRIAAVIDAVAAQTGKRPILVGGSGGGYAALASAHYLECGADVVVSNPQTLVAKYLKEAGHQFLKSAFGSRRPSGIQGPANAEELQSLLDEICPEFDTRVPDAGLLRRNKRVFYMQNGSDHAHVKHHARAFFENEFFPDRSGKCFVSEDGRLVFFPGDWGQGHAKTPMGLLNGVVSGIAQGWATRQIVQDCLEDSQWAAAKSFWTLMGQSIHRGNSSIRVEAAGDARVEVALTTPYPKRSLEYAFYLRGPSGELLQTPYQKSPKASFELAEMPLPALVTVFAKDGLGIIKTIRQRVVAL